MKTLLAKGHRSKYYHFHRDYDHDTKYCHDLNNQLKNSFVKDTSNSLYESTKNLHPDFRGRWRDKLMSSLEKIVSHVIKLTHELQLKNAYK